MNVSKFDFNTDGEGRTGDEIERLLSGVADETRREVIRYLDEESTPIPLPALATYVAKERCPEDEWKNFKPFRRRVLINLHHVALPTLDDAGVIRYTNGDITPGELFPEATYLVSAVDGLSHE